MLSASRQLAEEQSDDGCGHDEENTSRAAEFMTDWSC